MNEMFVAIEAPSVGKAWSEALQRVFFEGDDIPTDYDKEGDFPSKDATAAIHVSEPFSEPAFAGKKPIEIDGKFVYCHPGDVYYVESVKGGYLKEVMNGLNDHFIWKDSEEEKSYPYTYNDRLTHYFPVNSEDIKYLDDVYFVGNPDTATTIRMVLNNGDEKIAEVEVEPVDQIEAIIDHLKDSPYSRRAQAITWRPIADNLREDPPCLQSIWCRVFGDKLRMNTCWRSRDLFGAWEANVNAMLQIMQRIAEGLEVETGDYFDFSNSLHIYGRKKLVFKEVLPLLERVRSKEGLLKEEYNAMLDDWLRRMENEATG